MGKVPVSSEAAPGKARVRGGAEPEDVAGLHGNARWERVQGTYSERMGAVGPTTM